MQNGSVTSCDSGDPPASSPAGYNYFTRWPESNPTAGGGLFELNAITTASWWSSTEYYTSPLPNGIGPAAAIGFHVQVDTLWTGTLYLGDIQIY